MGKSYEEIAYQVIDGMWGNYPERKERLEAAGYDYQTVMKYVNAIYYGTNDNITDEEDDCLVIHFDTEKYSSIKVVFE